ncbi:hypothetical protein Afil01_57120 [Actinorhabdospora filicis]|uniref:Uncharacterized protein n=1 Tax=Actinorhabdospora filicis TaxID=1785913 RepID=A0A9W6SQ39_9ACTN|nr:hypothetical protein [Actinorhabdospora filicis]GLZ80905.1 hypothetical protein Afil01_57120 [Actinorhabdospora filicis]
MPEPESPRPEPVPTRIRVPDSDSYLRTRTVAATAGGGTLLAAVPVLALTPWARPVPAAGWVMVFASAAAVIAGGALALGVRLKAPIAFLGWSGLAAAVALAVGLIPVFQGPPGLLFAPLCCGLQAFAIALDVACAVFAVWHYDTE